MFSSFPALTARTRCGAKNITTRAFNTADHKKPFKNQVSRHLGVPTVASGVLHERIKNPDPKGCRVRLFNTALMTDAKGNVTGRCDKQCLLMFGECLPLGETFPVLHKISPNSGNFTPGRSFEPLPFGKHKLATMICHKDIIPSCVNKLMSHKPHLLVNQTNDAW